MAQPPRAFRIGSILWSLLLGGVVIFIGEAILLPSTKSSRVQTERIRQMAEQREREQLAAIAAAEAEAAGSTTAPVTAPSVAPSVAPSDAPGDAPGDAPSTAPSEPSAPTSAGR